MSDNRRWTGLTPDSFSNEIGGALKVMGHENEIQVSKKTQRGIWLLSLPIISTNTVYNLVRRLRLYQRKYPLNLAVMVQLLLFLTYYYKG